MIRGSGAEEHTAFLSLFRRSLAPPRFSEGVRRREGPSAQGAPSRPVSSCPPASEAPRKPTSRSEHEVVSTRARRASRSNSGTCRVPLRSSMASMPRGPQNGLSQGQELLEWMIGRKIQFWHSHLSGVYAVCCDWWEISVSAPEELDIRYSKQETTARRHAAWRVGVRAAEAWADIFGNGWYF